MSPRFPLHDLGVPDPPLNVQVELGPREGTLLLTWLPVTINSSGFSNGAVVTGYVVYADGNRIKEAKGPTSELNPFFFFVFISHVMYLGFWLLKTCVSLRDDACLGGHEVVFPSYVLQDTCNFDCCLNVALSLEKEGYPQKFTCCMLNKHYF